MFVLRFVLINQQYSSSWLKSFSIYDFAKLNGFRENLSSTYTEKKENHIFTLFKEIQKGSVAKSYMINGSLIYG